MKPKTGRYVIKIRPEYNGCLARPEVVRLLNGKTMMMKPMFIMDDDDKYPDEWALVPVYEKDQLEMFKVTAWIASGDVEFIKKGE